MLKPLINEFDELIATFKQNIKKHIKFFILIYVASILLYQFFINNLLINTYDPMVSGTFTWSAGWNSLLGRYFNSFLVVLFQGLNAEPLNTLIALLIICISIQIVFCLFDEENIFTAFLSMFIITSSSNYLILSHRYSSIAACVQLLFAILAVFVIVKFKNVYIKMFLSTLSIILSLASGQYSIALSLIIFFMYVLYSYLFYKLDIKTIIKISLQFVVSFILGIVLYRISWLLLLKVANMKLNDYFGNNEISLINIVTSVPYAFVGSFKAFYNYFTGKILQFNFFNAYYVYFVFFGVFIFILSFYVFKIYKSIVQVIVIDALIVLAVPSMLALTIYFTPSAIYIRPHQTIPYVFFIPIVAIFVKKILITSHIPKTIFIIFLISILHAQVLQMSADFDTMYRSKISTTNFYNLILNRLNERGLLSADNILFFGNITKNDLYYNQDYSEKYTKRDKRNHSFIVGNIDGSENSWYTDCIRGYINNYIGLDINMVYNGDYSKFLESDQYKNARPFPSDESIFVLDNSEIIVKVSD